MQSEKLHTILFGHIGESHLHFNLFPSNEAEKVRAWEIYEMCVNKALSFGGTVAAEHGIGKIKHKWLGIMYGEQGLQDMVQIKKPLTRTAFSGLTIYFQKNCCCSGAIHCTNTRY